MQCPPGQIFHGWSIAHRVFLLRCHPVNTEHSSYHTKGMNILFLLCVCLLTFLLLVGLLTTCIVVHEVWKKKTDKQRRLAELKRKLSIVQTV
jgi:hypothetical protein